MKKLVSSSEAAYLLGLSLQGVHYRIKQGQLESVKKEGKTYVYIDTSKIKQNEPEQNTPQEQSVQLSALVEAKDQQIRFLKKTVKFLKKNHEREIQRLQHNQEKIFSVFQSEVDLLKSAFNEMKRIYALEHEKKGKTDVSYGNEGFMDIKEFFIFMRQHKKTDSQVKKIILDRVRMNDRRFVYDKKNKELLIYKSDFLDLI